MDKIDTIILLNIESGNMKLLEIANENPNVINIILNVSYGLLENQKTTMEITKYFDNLPNHIKTVSIMTYSHYSRFGMPPMYLINLNNLPFSVEKVYLNNLCEINIKKLPFNCEIIFVKNDNLPKQYGQFQILQKESYLNLRLAKKDEYTIFLNNTNNNFDAEEN
jgi:hypothetical protein